MSAIAIADAYCACYISDHRASGGSWEARIDKDPLYDFLFANNFDPWLMNAFKGIFSSHTREFKEFIMKIHTGESLVSGTSSWTWEQRRVLGQRIFRDLAECILRNRYEDPEFGTYRKNMIVAVDAMQKLLELDGYVFREKVLWVPDETVIDEREEEGVVLGLILSLHLQEHLTLKHHLELSASHYQEERWDDSISNSRKLLEGVLRQVASQSSMALGARPLPPEDLEKPYAVRDFLEEAGLLEKKEKEVVKQIYGLLSDTGGHPYVAQRDQARLMRHLALTFCQFVLLRLEGALKKSKS